MMQLLFVALFTVLASAAPLAAEDKVHTVDMTVLLVDEHGKPAKDVLARDPSDSDCSKCPTLTLGRAVAHSLFLSGGQEQGRETVSAEQKWARAVLAERVKEDKAARLTADEVSVIKRQLATVYGGVILMQAYPILDPNSKPPAVK